MADQDVGEPQPPENFEEAGGATGLGPMRPLLRKACGQLPRPVRFRALNALDGFERAERLLETDRAIASFSAINAQEEAATALFRALQLQAYPGADRLQPNSHHHKAAIYPFIDAVRTKFARDVGGLELNVRLSVKPPTLTISIPVTALGLSAPELEGKALQSVHPLHFATRKDGRIYHFEEEFAELASGGSRNRIDRFVKRLANQRNILLYASDQGPPQSRAQLRDIHQRRSSAEALLYLSIAVLQTPLHQHLAMQGLEAFLKALGAAAGLEITYPPEREPDINFKAKGSEAPPGFPPETPEKTVNKSGGQ